jgi:hypothetical protein
MAEIDEIVRVLQKNCNPNPMGNMQECLTAAEIEAINLIKDFLDTLEVKEVDLNKELSYEDYIGFFKEHPNFTDDWGFDEAWVFAKYFFELGLAQKGE